MVSFKEYVLKEYRHNMADGMAKNSPHPHNGKGNNIARNQMGNKIPYVVGPYKPLNTAAHQVGQIFIGNRLTNLLLDYGMEFQDGKTHTLKNSDKGIQMSINTQGQQVGQIVKVK